MNKYEQVLDLFKAKVNNIAWKHSVTRLPSVDLNPYLKLNNYFLNFNTKLQEFDEALNLETDGVLRKYVDDDSVDFCCLLDGLNIYTHEAKINFMKMNNP